MLLRMLHRTRNAQKTWTRSALSLPCSYTRSAIAAETTPLSQEWNFNEAGSSSSYTWSTTKTK